MMKTSHLPQSTSRLYPSNYLWTSECVGSGHPDKVADQISDAILDACLLVDPHSRVACETLVKNHTVVLAGEISTTAAVDYQDIVEKTLGHIGYNYQPTLVNLISEQSQEISRAVGDHDDGAGDQGIMFGYASPDTPELMPLTIQLSRNLVDMLEYSRNKFPHHLMPDCKTQVTVKYDSTGKPLVVDQVVISTQHGVSFRDVTHLRSFILTEMRTWFGIGGGGAPYNHLFVDSETKYMINPAGLWTIGGPAADCGLTGRKIVVDGYGADCQWGGGALSGKDPTKVDRSAAYAARYIAKNLVHLGMVEGPVKVQLSYAIGKSEPTSFRIITDNSSVHLEKHVSQFIDLRPRAIIERFDLRNPIYFTTASKGHFGVNPRIGLLPNGKEVQFYPWEKTDLFA